MSRQEFKDLNVLEHYSLKLHALPEATRVPYLQIATCFILIVQQGPELRDFPLEVRPARFGLGASMEGTLVFGGGTFRFETVNGAIRITNRGGVAQR